MIQKIAIFASHNGTNFQTLIEACESGNLNAQVVCLYCNNKEAYAIERAKKFNIPYELIPSHRFESEDQMNEFLIQDLKKRNVKWIILAGYMKKIGTPIIKTYENKIINTHPSLLPKFGGKGMYGHKVHEAVIKAKEKETGMTVHIVTENFDEGPIVAQKKIEVKIDDTPESLAQRLKKVENQFLVETLKKLFN